MLLQTIETVSKKKNTVNITKIKKKKTKKILGKSKKKRRYVTLQRRIQVTNEINSSR